ncbi:hypothetical protein M409DRAFT_71407 [Zasmidium cellare ATCC 36951]|uniref:Extracellular membrane protein CFEM domain-containing protein n=1 Tax=Zasmidium cellare ATCC 36951 TaxID=1080233 RepID=A0A6A6BZI3_ZASCE|nr:uncharacterized protein M409DRAFT_71407 [Zasmidium cellare ATCC 36951]KAF2158846.1 hypothetical protein M409DRAFT_71407 [Zasmidium cellare ATCC 36951]
MKFVFLALACLTFLAVAQIECSCPNGGAAGGPACGCNSNASCFCERESDDLPVATECSGLGSCGCPSDQNVERTTPPPPPKMF